MSDLDFKIEGLKVVKGSNIVENIKSIDAYLAGLAAFKQTATQTVNAQGKKIRALSKQADAFAQAQAPADDGLVLPEE